MDEPRRCPHCQALVVDRRSAVCTTCRHELPAAWVMTPLQAAKTDAINREIAAQHVAAMRSLDPLITYNLNASVIVQILNASSIPGSP